MPVYSYAGLNPDGKNVAGIIDAESARAARLKLRRSGVFPTLVSETRTEATPRASRSVGRLFERIGAQEIAVMTRQLSTLVSAGLPLVDCLSALIDQVDSERLKRILSQTRERVNEGSSLADALTEHSKVFSELYVNMVRAGESSGALVEVLRRMADHFEKFATVQAKFTSALIYPAFVSVVGIAIAFFFMSYMLPKFMTIFEGMNVPLPMMTQILVGISHFFAGYWWLMISVVIVAIIIFKRFQATENGRLRIDQWKMRAPVFGKVVRLNLFGQFARTLSTLLENGVPVLTALKITEQILPNRIVKEAIAKTREEVTDGKTIAQPLARSKVFPQLMVDLVKIGEETGDVPGALKNVADTYENELAIALRVMTNMIEPVMIIVMACGVGFLLLSVLSAMFAITSNIAR
jgi:type II secretion system protein F